MKKKIFIIIFTVLFSIFSFSSIFATWNIATDFSQENAEIKINKKAKNVVENYKGNSETPYARFVTLEAALESANAEALSGTEIHVYIITNSEIQVQNKNLTLNDGVNLYLPYDGKTFFTDSQDEYSSYMTKTFSDNNATGVKNNRKCYVELINSTLTINEGAELYIGGEFGSRGVSGRYGEIALDKYSKIICSGSIYAYGYIKELKTINFNQEENKDYEKLNNENDSYRYLKFTKTGYLKTPLAIHDLKSGNQLTTLVESNICPFNIFEFPNIQTFTSFEYGAKMDANVRMSVSSSYFSITTGVIRTQESGENALFLTGKKSNDDEGTVSFEYCPTNTNGYTTVGNVPTYIYINSELSIGSLEMEVSIVTINTADYFLPFSYKMQHFVLDGAKLNISNKIKYLPGSSLFIQNNGILNLSSSLIFYKSDSFDNVIGSGYSGTYDDAKFIVNGKLECSESAAIGAFIETTDNLGVASLNFKNIAQTNLTVSSYDGTNNYEVKITSSGNFKINNEIKSAQFKERTTFYSSSDCCWNGEYILTSIVQINIQDLYEYNIGNYKVYQADDANGTNAIELTPDGVYLDTNSQFEIQQNKYVKIEVIRAYSASFENNTNIFASSNYYLVTDDITLNIIPNEGILLGLTTQGTSGAGGAKFTVTETASNYVEEITSNGTLKLIKNAAFTVDFSWGMGSTSMDKAYIAEGTFVKNYPSSGSTPENYCSESNLTNMKEISFKYSAQATTNLVIFVTSKTGCFADGTLILMADGTYKAIENIEAGELIQTINHETGKLEIQRVFAIVEKEVGNYEVLRLKFSNGKYVDVLIEHGFFDMNLLQYVQINKNNVFNYIGHSFYSIDGKVQLEGYDIFNTYTHIWSIASYKNINAFANGMLSVSDDIEGFYNIFEYDENLKYNPEAYERDLQLYGLFSYEELKHLISYEMYEGLNAKYLKVAIGKGLVTMEKLLQYLEKYSQYFNYHKI